MAYSAGELRVVTYDGKQADVCNAVMAPRSIRGTNGVPNGLVDGEQTQVNFSLSVETSESELQILRSGGHKLANGWYMQLRARSPDVDGVCNREDLKDRRVGEMMRRPFGEVHSRIGSKKLNAFEHVYRNPLESHSFKRELRWFVGRTSRRSVLNFLSSQMRNQTCLMH